MNGIPRAMGPITSRFFSVVWLTFTCVLFGLSLICLGNFRWPPFYFVDIFTIPLLTAACLGCVVSLVARQTRAFMLTAAAAIVLAWSSLPQINPPQAHPAPGGQTLRLVFANLWMDNPTPARLLPWIHDNNPDIVIIVETNAKARNDLLPSIRATRPYFYSRFDTIIASRWPLRNGHPIHLGFALNQVTVDTPEGPFDLVVVHLHRPWPYSKASVHPTQFKALARALASVTPRRCVMVGDFNSPPLASGMQDFVKFSGMHTAPALWGTWNSKFPGLLRLNIDNALASPDFVFTQRKVGPFNGSDHRPIALTVRSTSP